MKAGTNVRARDLNRHQPAKFDYTIRIQFLDKWAERTKDAILLPWADGVTRSNRLFIGGVLVDQQEGDKYTGEPCVCHCYFAPRKRYLKTGDFEAKTMRKVRQRVEIAAAGGYLKGSRNSKRVVKWDPDGRNVRPGPGIIAIGWQAPNRLSYWVTVRLILLV